MADDALRPSTSTRARLFAATFCSLAASALVGRWSAHLTLFALPAALLAAAGGLVHRRSLGAQLYSRAAWWSNLLFA